MDLKKMKKLLKTKKKLANMISHTFEMSDDAQREGNLKVPVMCHRFDSKRREFYKRFKLLHDSTITFFANKYALIRRELTWIGKFLQKSPKRNVLKES